MNYKKLLPKRILVCVMLLSVFILSGCTKKFDEINTDPTRLPVLINADINGLFTSAEYMAMYSGNGSAEYQYAQGFVADLYCQYSAITETFDPTDRYNIVQEWLQEQWFGTFRAMAPLYNIIKVTTGDDKKAMNAIARIWKVWTIHRATDYYGPMPYFSIGIDSTVVPYDKQEDIYHDLFKELTEATAVLEANVDQLSFGGADLIFGGDNSKWLKFANTLRLRLAMRISNVEPALAKTEAEAAVANGVMDDVSDDAYLASSPVNYNGFNRQSGWNEFRMSAAMQSILVGYSDPRLPKFWQPAVNTGVYKGVRNGMDVGEIVDAANVADNNSQPSLPLLPENLGSTPSTVMHSAEAYFLRAEGVLNGWDMGGGTAESLYNQGIEMSMKTWGINDNTVINNYVNSSAVPIALNDIYNTPALTDIPVKFGTDPEKQREQIITQKWISLFPEGHEAWAEHRRSGYPKLYPLLHSDNPDAPVGTEIKRVPFLDYDRDRNGAAVDAAEALLGGPDKISTRLWWDVN
ncbi:MAG: SusD/RagB family nutrient-binding outer membrane lipoprotein [Flavitalea sp.]